MYNASDQSLHGESAPTIPPTTDVNVPINQQTSVKQRKVRKGTHSCWECKRRKIRCIFSLSGDAVCSSCQRRRTPCISQDMPEDLCPATKGNRNLAERISRVENFMREVLASRDETSTETEPHQSRHPISEGPETRTDIPPPPRTCVTPAEGLEQSPANLFLPTPDSQGESEQAETETVIHHLFSAFPAESDAKILLRASSRPSLYTFLVNTQPHNKLTSERLAAPTSIPELPSANTHPVMLAKLMLTLAITLQIPGGEEFVGLSESRDTLMQRLMNAARTWVTTKEDMHGTVESLICIILEGVFETNSGKLRRAWAVYRRAMTAAQLMGLHRSPTPPLKYIDPELDATPEYLWFRIVYMDRYLSLLLGLPHGTSDKSIRAMPVMQNESPLGRFEQALTLIASHILERNDGPLDRNDITTTRSLDTELLRLSTSMPPKFWRPIDFHNLMPGSPDALLETVRLAAQVYYYGLLIQLHLPYMMRAGDNTDLQYSKMTCVNAGREIMARFIAHRRFNPISSCSRPVDFFALLAAMTLILAHIDAHHHPETASLLAHQRPSDRAILDQALERMEVISSTNKDTVAAETAGFIRKLLNIEAAAADGVNYATTTMTGDNCAEEANKIGEELCLPIPYIGVIKIARQGPISREPPPGNFPSQPNQTFTADFFQEHPLITSEHTLESLLHESLTNELTFNVDQNSAYQRSPSAQLRAPESEQSTLQYPSSINDNMVLDSELRLPSVLADINDCAFQGVDTAFFDNLMRGTSHGSDAELER